MLKLAGGLMVRGSTCRGPSSWKAVLQWRILVSWYTRPLPAGPGTRSSPSALVKHIWLLVPILGSPGHEIHGLRGMSPPKGRQDQETQVSVIRRGWDMCCLRWRREGSGRSLSVYIITEGRQYRRGIQVLFSGAQWHNKRKRAQLKYRKCHLNIGWKHFYSKDAETQKQVAQRCCEVRFLRDTENLSGHGIEQPALAGPALTMGLD